MHKKINEQNLHQIIDYYNNVKSLRDTSEHFNISIPTIHNTLKESGVPTKIDRKNLGEKIRKFKLDPYYFSKIDNRDKAYIMGLLHSDGCVCKGTRQVRLKLTDIELVEAVNSKIYENRPLYISEANGRNKKAATMVITHDQIFKDVQKHGCGFNKSYSLEFPTTIPEHLMNDYFRGFFDGDGCVYINNGLSYKPITVSIIATNNWIQGAIKFLSNYNIRGKNYHDRRHDSRIGSLTISDVTSVRLFYEYIYKEINNQIYLERKYNVYSEGVLFKMSLDNFDRNFDETETFISLDKYPNIQIGNKGTIKSVFKENDHIKLKPYPNNMGYLSVTISGGKTREKRKMVHSLVAEAFLPKPFDKTWLITHKDRNKLNNCAENLEWKSRSEICKEDFIKGRRKNYGEGCNLNKLSEDKVKHIATLLEEGMKSDEIAKKYKISTTTIDHIKYGRTWKHLKLKVHSKTKTYSKISSDTRQEIKELYDKGNTQKAIANMFSIDQSTVSKIISK